MAIEGYIQELLWNYECVIIPGFGGILATYRPAQMVLAEHTLYPPCKSLAFNEYLTATDGLLINYICQNTQISYTEATEKVEVWVKKTKNLISQHEEIYLPQIGRFYQDIERKLRFEPDTAVNYLASAYGLKMVIAEPILRNKSADTIEIIEPHRASYILPKANKKWAMAAIIILLLALGTVANLMYKGVDVKPLNLNAASVMGFLESFYKPEMPAPEPKPSISHTLPAFNNPQKAPNSTNVEQPFEQVTERANNTPEPVTKTVVEESADATLANATGKKYYIIIGAFKKRANFQNAFDYLRDKHASEEIYEDTSLEKKRIGFYAGNTYQEAYHKLIEARKDQQDYWLLVKK